eukprot:g27263.t1
MLSFVFLRVSELISRLAPGLTGTATRSRPRTVGTPAFGVVQRCVDETPLRSFECSLVHAHRGILQRIEGGSTGHALVLEDSEWAPQRGDDARLNRKISSTQAQELLMGQFERNFVMLGWCEPSCAHAYLVSPQGASMLLSRGFDRPKLPADAMFPAFATEERRLGQKG